jgi:hypothetical protein
VVSCRAEASPHPAILDLPPAQVNSNADTSPAAFSGPVAT